MRYELYYLLTIDFNIGGGAAEIGDDGGNVTETQILHITHRTLHRLHFHRGFHITHIRTLYCVSISVRFIPPPPTTHLDLVITWYFVVNYTPLFEIRVLPEAHLVVDLFENDKTSSRIYMYFVYIRLIFQHFWYPLLRGKCAKLNSSCARGALSNVRYLASGEF